MYIVAIAWMYVVVLMAATQTTIVAGIATVVFYGVVPCGVVMYILMAPSRAKRKKRLQQQALEQGEQAALMQQASPAKPMPSEQKTP